MLLTAACDQSGKRRKWTKQDVEHLTDSSDIYEAFKSAVDPELFEVCFSAQTYAFVITY